MAKEGAATEYDQPSHKPTYLEEAFSTYPIVDLKLLNR